MHAVNSIADDGGVTLPHVAELRALGARLLGPDLIVYPVRHHSPACAWHLRGLLEHTAVSTVLVEGPSGFDRLIPQLVHPQATMPLAIYTYAVMTSEGQDPATADGRRRAAYYPFCDHSPELVALRHAAARGIPARFIDLDFAEQCVIEGDATTFESRSLLDERHLTRSRHLATLASRLHCRDHEELWEHLFEIPATGRSAAEQVASIAAYCQLARSGYGDDELAADGTLAREAEMVAHVRDALAARGDGDGPVLVVVGGFHAVALLDGLDRHVDAPTRGRAAVTDQASALIRYSLDRLDRLNGYSAGMTSPAWHQQVWQRLLRHAQAGIDIGARVRQEQALETLSAIAAELREHHDLSLPMPVLGAAYEQTLQLARLRGRSAPAREDLVDAVTSCFVKGDADADGSTVLAVAHRILSGTAIGVVPPGTDRPPLVVDFLHRAARLRLKVDGVAHKTVLDIYRRDEHRRISRLMHGLTLLGVPFGVRLAGPDFVLGTGLDRLREQWEYAVGAATEAALVEASVHGTTVPQAVATRFRDRLARMDNDGELRQAKSAAAMLTHACVLGLHDAIDRVTAPLAAAIAQDASFESVAAATGTLGLLWESREPLEARAVPGLPQLLKSAYERAMFLGRGLQDATGDGSDLIEALSRLRELLASDAGAALDATLLRDLLATLSSGHTHPAVRGAVLGLRHCAGEIDDETLTTTVRGHLDGLLPATQAVAFLRGLLQTAREVAWQQPMLLSMLDDLLGRWEDGVFVAALPELRLAFAAMTPNETDRIAQAVAGLHGREDLGRLVRDDVDADELQRRLLLSRDVTRRLASDGLGGWLA